MNNQIFRCQSRQGRLSDSGCFPGVVLLDTVSFCNLKCAMCVHKDMKRAKGIMPWKLFTKIIDEIAAADKNTRVWMVFFGEALLLKNNKPSIFEMIAYAKKKGLKDVVLNSNANLMDKECSRKLIECGLDAIYIGIDALNPKTYAKIRVGGNLKSVVKNTVALIKLKKKMKARKPQVYVQFVQMPENGREKEGFIRFWKEQGAVVKIRPKVSWAGLVDAPSLVLDNRKRWPCHWAMQTMSITDSGKVVTCAVDLDARFVAGDVTKKKLTGVWNGKLRKLRQMHLSGRYQDLPIHCRECRDWQSARADYF